MKLQLFAAAAAVLSLAAAPVLAEDKLILPGVTLAECRTHNATQEKADRDLMLSTFDVMRSHDMKKLNRLLPDLETALSHAPDVAVSAERCGDTINLYSDDMTRLLIVSAVVAKMDGMEKAKVVQYAALPYGLLGFQAGWIYYEKKDFAKAHAAYAKGMLNDPEEYTLVVEDSLTLSNLHRNDEALTLVDGFLAAHPNLEDKDRAALLRKRGYVLVELRRLDDAEAAYKQSLELEPGNPIAEGELQYITQQRK